MKKIKIATLLKYFKLLNSGAIYFQVPHLSWNQFSETDENCLLNPKSLNFIWIGS